MSYGVNQAAETTNSLVKRYIPTIVPTVEENSVFEEFYKVMPKPEGTNTTVNFIIANGRDEAHQQPPGAGRISTKGAAYEVEVHIPDKWRDSRQITWEQISRKRFDVVENETRNNAVAMAAARNVYLRGFLDGNAGDNSGTPTAPTAPSTGETPYWWNANDTKTPPPYGGNTFSAGHNHLETGAASAITLNRLQDDVIGEIAEHGYGAQGIAVLVNLQEERTLLKLATATQSNQTLAQEMRDRFQKAGNVSSLTGLFGLTFLRNEWVVRGTVIGMDANLASLPQGGAVRVVETELSSYSEQDHDTQSTWIESWESAGAGVLHKGAGTVLHVAD